MNHNDLFRFRSDVRAALDAARPVVALESTVIAHGLPAPLNLQTGRRLEQIVRDYGATPATVAVFKGRLCIGIDDEELEFLSAGAGVHKVTRRDLPIAVAQRWDGATTVASTMWIAHRAGIHVFATGGIGGVHRGNLQDVSADLPELARTPMIVVCSGPKIVLDLAATREWLETFGVTVIGFGCDVMPAFYSRASNLAVDARVERAEEVAAIAAARSSLSTEGALLVTVPVPESAEIPADLIESRLERDIIEAEKSGISGRDVTPFLLGRLARAGDGQALRANVALLENNARVAAEIACALCQDNGGS